MILGVSCLFIGAMSGFTLGAVWMDAKRWKLICELLERNRELIRLTKSIAKE